VRKRSWLLFLALPLAVLSAGQAEADTCPSGGDTTYATYLALGAGGCTIGDKTFFGFTHGGDVAASDIDVSIVNDGTNFGFVFQMPLAVIGGSGVGTTVADVGLTYNVRVTDGSALITDVTVLQTSFTSGSAFATVSETVCIGSTLPGCEGGIIASLDTSDADPFDQIEFAPVSVVGLLKDFVVAASNCPNGGCNFASLSIVQNTVSQTVPEPSTLLLIGSALVGVATLSRKKG
jgi:hypothetical protein